LVFPKLEVVEEALAGERVESKVKRKEKEWDERD